MKENVATLCSVAAATLSLALTGCSNSTASSANIDHSPAPRTVRGSFDLYYTLQTSPSSTGGTGNQPEKISAIHFYETYIVVERTKFGNRLLPIDKIIDLRWN